jgi:poly(A) polymerase
VLIRYKTDSRGRAIPQAKIYTKEEHKIRLDQIDFEAVKIARRLQRAGFEAFIVGGAIRDLLSGRIPKDFDVATSAEPNQIRRLFRNSRIIGKRFRLVHIFYPNNNIIEVSTFRAKESEGFKNLYGGLEEDSKRRDFTMNALYFDPVKEQILDFTTGFDDIAKRVLKPVIPLNQIFVEDPVRILRAVKYSITTGASIPFLVGRKIKKQSYLLKDISASRLTEEIFKILLSGTSGQIFEALAKYQILEYLLPSLYDAYKSSKKLHEVKDFQTLVKFLKQLDEQVLYRNEDRRSRAIAYLSAHYFYFLSPWKDQKKQVYTLAFTGIKDLLKPISPANRDVEQAIHLLLRNKVSITKETILQNILSDQLDVKENHTPASQDGDETKPTHKKNRRRRKPRAKKPEA